MRNKLDGQQNSRPTFWEPILVECFQEKGPDGTPSLSYEIRWREIYTPAPQDDLSTLLELADRAALVWHGLTRHDLFHPPVHRPDRWRYVTSPTSERKIQAYYRTQQKLLNAFFRSRKSFTYRWVRRMADADFGTIDILQAGLQLGLFHRLYGIEICYRNLAMVLGTSKSTLYRRYGNHVVEALRLAHRYARSTTQSDKDKASHEEWNSSSVESRPKDLPFELLLNAAIQLVRRGKSANSATLTAYLRRQGALISTQHVCDFYSGAVINNAIAAPRPTAA